MSFDHLGLHIGPVLISLFGLILIAAFAAGGVLTFWLARRAGEDPDPVYDVVIWLLLLGIVMGRLVYIFNPPPSVAQFYDRNWYLSHPLDFQAGLLAVWSGGLSRVGMMLAGIVTVALVLWRRKLAKKLWLDILTPGILLGLVIAPWANIVNRHLYGPPTTLPWGMQITLPLAPYDDPLQYPPDALRFHPTPAYVSLWALLSLGVLFFLKWRYAERLQEGDLFLGGWLIMLPGLFLFDFLRLDVNYAIIGLTDLQILTLLMLIGIGILVWRRRANIKNS